MSFVNMFLPLVLIASSVLPDFVVNQQIDADKSSQGIRTDGIDAAEKLFQLLNKRHLNHLQPDVYKKSEPERLLEKSLELWDPEKQFFVEKDMAQLRMHLGPLSGNMLAVNFRLATALQSLIVQRVKDIQHYLKESFTYESNSRNVQKISALRIPEHHCSDISSLLDLWSKVAQYQILKECHDTGNFEVNAASECYQGAIRTLVDNIKTMADSLSVKDIQEKHLRAYAASFGPYTAYTLQEDSGMPLKYYGLADEFGVQVRLLASGDVTIESVHFTDRSGNSGVEPGDILIQVNDEVPRDINIRNKLVEIYPEDTSLKLTLIRNDTLYIVTVTKQKTRSSSGHLYSQTFENGSILYLRIPSFYDRKKGSSSVTMVDSVRVILNEWQESVLHTKGILIDLRQNGGGALVPALNVLGLFLNDTVALQVRNAKGALYSIKTDEEKVSFSGRIVVLVDEETGSASEIFSAALQDYGIALIAGSRTFGKGFMQEIKSLTTGKRHYERTIPKQTESVFKGYQQSLSGRVTITRGQLYRATGIPLHQDGVTPDIQIYQSPDVSRTDTTLPWKGDNTSVPSRITTHLPVIEGLTRLQNKSTERLQQKDTFLQRQQWADQYQLYMETGIELTPEDVHRYLFIKRNYEKAIRTDLNTATHALEEDVELAEGILILKDMMTFAER